MRRVEPSRKARFKAALAYAGMTGVAWRQQEGVSWTHLRAVLNGERESSDRLREKIDAFIEANTPQTTAA